MKLNKRDSRKIFEEKEKKQRKPQKQIGYGGERKGDGVWVAWLKCLFGFVFVYNFGICEGFYIVFNNKIKRINQKWEIFSEE